MANTGKKTVTPAKKSTSVKAEPAKKAVEVKETKSITAKPEAKKIATAKAPEKITTAKAPEKITAAKEPKKLMAAKEPEKIAVKATPKKATAKVETKAAVKAEPKTATKVEPKKAEKPAVKKAEPKKAAKPVAKKVEATVAKKETKAVKTVKAAVKEEAKTTVKAEPKKEVKKAVKKPAAKEVAKTVKAEPKKATVKKPVKVAEKKASAKTEKKPVAPKKTGKKEKLTVYEALSLEECIARVQAMGVQHVYEDYARFLMDETELKKVEKNIVDGNDLKNKDFDFEKDGYDVDLVLITLQKVADTMDIKALDYKDLKKDMNAAVKTSFGEDAEANAAEYLKEFKICEKLLMIGQRKNLGDSAMVTELIGADVEKFIVHFFDLAYAVLPSWQYDDVKFYEDFAFAVLSQYYDLFMNHQLRVLIDIADLYILHGDFQHGDECYGYILRDNQIKDYIYYRFASIYEGIDFNKAKGLAYESLQYVDGRFTYYQNIMDIINKQS